MSVVKILQSKNKILRRPANLVSLDLIGTKKLNGILEAMSAALHREEDGIAIAAPQIGIALRIFLVSSQVFLMTKKAESNPNRSDNSYPVDIKNHQTSGDPKKPSGDLVFINPKIIRRSKKTVWLDEGCLSVRWLYGQVRRATKATIFALDRNGQKFTWTGTGLLAQIFQHEIDHLDGILFTDKARKLRQIKPIHSDAQSD